MKCSIPGCNKEAKVKGLCWAHYAQLRRHNGVTLQERESTSGECKVKGCHNPIKARGLCNKHYKDYQKRGLLKPRKYKGV